MRMMKIEKMGCEYDPNEKKAVWKTCGVAYINPEHVTAVSFNEQAGKVVLVTTRAEQPIQGTIEEALKEFEQAMKA